VRPWTFPQLRLVYLTVESFGSSPKHAGIGQESFGVVVCWFVDTVAYILGLVWPSFGPKSGLVSKISGRILERFRGPVSSAEQRMCLPGGGGGPEPHRLFGANLEEEGADRDGPMAARRSALLNLIMLLCAEACRRSLIQVAS
jgi:hypothetical protein